VRFEIFFIRFQNIKGGEVSIVLDILKERELFVFQQSGVVVEERIKTTNPQKQKRNFFFRVSVVPLLFGDISRRSSKLIACLTTIHIVEENVEIIFSNIYDFFGEEKEKATKTIIERPDGYV
jgi:hypothetical protein